MKYALSIALTLLSSAAALAGTPEESYLAARDAFIAKFNPPGDPVAPSDAASKEEERARADLLKQMRGVIGPLNVKGFSGESAYNVGSLFKGDLETGILDGLVFTRDKDVRTALTQDTFYTRATSADAAVGNMSELPVTKPAGVDFVFAMLAARRQDFFPVPASEMLIGAIVPPRVYILSAPIAQIKMMPPCEKIFKDAVAKADKLYETRDRSAEPKESVTDAAEGIREKGDEAMRKCFAQRMKSDPAFAKLTKQAQEYVDALAAK